MHSSSRTEAVRNLYVRGYLELYDRGDDHWMSLHYDHKTKELHLSQSELEDEKIDWRKALRLIKQYYDRFPLVYVNAYAVSRHCVHPAEGGIYLDFGEPLASVPVLHKGNAVEKEIDRLKELLGHQFERGWNRYSVLGGEDLQVMVESHQAKPFPDKPYVYE